MRADLSGRSICVEQAHGGQISEDNQVTRDPQDQVIYILQVTQPLHHHELILN